MVAPANDNFADAMLVLIPTAGGTWTSPAIDQTSATTESGEPAGSAGGATYSDAKSVWFKYVPYASGTVTIDTQLTTGANKDTQITFYQGTALSNLVVVASDWDSGGSSTSRIASAAVTAGQTYYLQSGVWAGGTITSLVARFVGPIGTVGRAIATSTARKAFQSTDILYDTYTHTDSTSSVGTPEIGGPYTQTVGTWGISSNRLYTSASTANSLLTFAAAADLTIEVTIAVTSSSASGVVFRYADSSNYWSLQSVSNNAYLYRNVAGTAVQMSGPSPTIVNGSVLKVAAIGDMIYGYVNNVLWYVLQDSHLKSSTTAGVRINSSTAIRLDDLHVSTLTTNPMAIDSSSNIQVYKGRDLSSDDTGSAT